MTSNLSIANERPTQIKSICLRLLSQREHTRLELLHKLALRGFNETEVSPIIAELVAADWQNDARYVEVYVSQRIQKGDGPYKIKQALQQRGIQDIAAMTVLVEEYGGWLSVLQALYIKKYGVDIELSQVEWLKRSRFLQQRGFSLDMIKQLLSALKIKLVR